ncbi:choice-of-anchor I family protein [Roseivivax isoporae]|uniref:Alkaline phosphatase n=1 Tax=Roseivivax isoporae LMG 25204 TaxID=1449351 RepID=X7F3H7_9RHOB|nr:choice-of-anchor I family protein [Roseivivax isoporae]ETX27303.1 alkaline phosphatase [Roseivivax isoporae LMG 25204]
MNAKISEFQSNPPGADPAFQSIELVGTPGASFSGVLLSIESDAGTANAGSINDVATIEGTFDAQGLLTASIADLENPSFTLVLVDGFTGTTGTDFDSDDDGTPDVDLAAFGITQVFDAVGIADEIADEARLYGAALGGTDLASIGFEPEVVFRAGSTGAFFQVRQISGIGDQVFDADGMAVDGTLFDADPQAGTTFGAINPALLDDGGVPETDFVLELLHIADQEASAGAISDAPNLSAVVAALRAQDADGDGSADDNTLFLSSGDAFIPGVFFDAGAAVFGAPGIADVQIQNELGLQAIALGNHEFDLGTGTLAGLIDGTAADNGTLNALIGSDFAGTLFPYLSTNLDFSTDPNLAPLAVAGGQTLDASLGNTVTSSTVAEVNGERIGIVGATTPTLASISSPGTVGIAPAPFGATPTAEQLDALAAEIQAEVDALLAADPTLDKIILLAHMQRIDIELSLAERLENVDIIVAGGSNTRLFDENDVPRSGDSDQGTYPLFVTNAGGTTTAVVNTDGSYKYVGRLVIDFDADGNIIPASYDADVSGAYATDDAGVAALGAEALVDPEIEAIVDAIEAEIIANESNVFGVSDVFLNGNRSGGPTDGVRTQETNLGNLTADANLAIAKETDPTVVVSIKNGGGIRASIGETVVPPGGTEAVRLPTAELRDGDGNIVKPAGGISQNDIQTALAFNNGLTLVTLTKAELVAILEHGVSALPGVAGQFPQISGVRFSFDPDLPAGDRIQSAAVVDEAGEILSVLVEDGEIAGDPSATFRVVTLNFLAGGGDGYPFPTGDAVDRVDLFDLDADGTADGTLSGDATFAADGTEQDALAEYLDDTFNPANGGVAYGDEDTAGDLDERIQNLDLRADTVLGDAPAPEPLVLEASLVTVFQGQSSDPDDAEGASEVVAHEDGTLYVTNGNLGRIDVFDLTGAEAPRTIDLTGLPGFDGVQSVAVRNGVVAVAIAAPNLERTIAGTTFEVTQPGSVAFFDATTLELLSQVTVGTLPDQIVFSADGTSLLVANEGQSNGEDSHSNNPAGTVSVIDTTDATQPTVSTLGFDDFNGLEDALRDAGIRIREGISASLDFEPEYIALSPDGTTAFVSLQENNAIARVDLASLTVTEIFSLGTQDFSTVGIDPNDDGVIGIGTFPNLQGLRMADGIASFEVGGVTYIATANEGDSRGDPTDDLDDVPFPGRADEVRVGDILDGDVPGVSIDPSVDTTGLERLLVSVVDGDTDGDGDIDVLTTFSARSFSIFDADGNLVFDSGDDFERIIAEVAPERFNNDDGENIATEDDNRSDAKGPEPEAITVGEVDGRILAFIGLERDSGIMVYDVTDPANASFTTYIPPLFTGAAAPGQTAYQSPEIVTFIPQAESTSPYAQIAVSYEVSGSTAVFDLVTPVTIMDIQGAGHVSRFAGSEVITGGIVTAVDFNGYYLQDATGDGDAATSDAIFVFTGNGGTSGISVGDEVRVRGAVSEFIPGGASSGNLSTTQITDTGAAATEILSSGNALPAATVLGDGGRAIPTEVIISEDELPVNLQEEAGTFNPETDGIDFYESLEGMRVTVEDAVAISPTNNFDETWVLANGGANATPGLNDRGGLNINAGADGYGDLNPERIQLQYDSFFDLLPDGFTPPDINTGDALGDVTGVVGYAFGNFEINVTDAFSVETPSANAAETTTVAAGDDVLTVATYNVLNLTSNFASGDDEDADAAQMALLGQQIAQNLGAPDIIGLQEIQDNSGVNFNLEDGVTSADETLSALIEAIVAAGGPRYEFVDSLVDVEGETGGVPGGNIRNAYLYNPDRVSLVEAVTLETAELAAYGVTNTEAFNDAFSRDPLLGVFEFNGEQVTLINNHWESRSGSEPIFGGPQPFFQNGEDSREQQALAINQVVDAILADDADANVVVLGDLNTFEFTDELAEDLPGAGADKVLTNLADIAEGDEAYSFNFQGNSQALDHIFATAGLTAGAQVDYVHVNTDFVNFASDHDPLVAAFRIEGPEDLFLSGTKGRDVLTGGRGDDRIVGFDGRDSLEGGDGDDRVIGGGGRDLVSGGAGNDTLWGGDANDTIVGGDGDDVILGGLGRDDITGGGGDDWMSGSLGRDTFRFVGDFGDDSIHLFERRQDDIVIEGATDADVTLSRDGRDLLITVDAEDTFGTIRLLNTQVFDFVDFV